MVKYLIYLLVLLFSLASCEKIYTPKIDIVQGQLVVEALITNDPTQNFVHLTQTTSFYDQNPAPDVSGASVSLIEINGSTFKGTESSTGLFSFNVIPVTGQNYKLQIILNNNTYESEIVKMPPLPAISRFYTGYVDNKVYTTDGYGVPVATDQIGSELYIDASVREDLSCYRFNSRAALEWIYSPPAMGPPPPPVYGWQSVYATGDFNIAGPKQFTQSGEIVKQPLMLLPFYSDTQALLKPDSIPNGWIFILDQYGTTQGSYNFHAQLNSQFNATGSLFDPIETQVYGNMTCKTDSSKIVYGYFDLNSYKQSRYYLMLFNPKDSVYQRQLFTYPDIPNNGQKVGIPPDWWQ